MFEKSTWIRLPRNVVVGHGVIDRTIEVVSEVAADHGWEVEITGSEDGGTRVDLRTSVS